MYIHVKYIYIYHIPVLSKYMYISSFLYKVVTIPGSQTALTDHTEQDQPPQYHDMVQATRPHSNELVSDSKPCTSSKSSGASATLFI